MSAGGGVCVCVCVGVEVQVGGVGWGVGGTARCKAENQQEMCWASLLSGFG